MELENATKKEKKTSKTKKSKKEISSEEETDEEEDYKIESESSDSEGTSAGSSETESEGEVIIKKKKETSNKRKRLATPEKTKGKKLKKDTVTQKKDEEREGRKMDTLKQKKEEEKEEKKKEEMMSKEGETNVTDSKINQSIQPMPKETEKIYTQVEGSKTDKKTKKVVPSFDSGKVDFNLHTEDPTNINNRTVQISSGLKMQCKMMSGLQSFTTKINYPDWAALAFIKKIKDDKVFEFNVPLKDAPKIMEGIKLLIKENPRFFDS